MKKVIYFILGIASLAVLLGMAYAGLDLTYDFIPAIDFIAPLVLLYPTFSSITGTIVAFPVLVMTIYALTYFFDKGIKILFLILTIIAIVAILLMMFGVLV